MESPVEEVQRRVEAEVRACVGLRNLQRFSDPTLESHVIRPPRRIDVKGLTRGSSLTVWSVLDEVPGDASRGFLVVCDLEAQRFGLATKPASGYPATLIGFYDSLRDALEGM